MSVFDPALLTATIAATSASGSVALPALSSSLVGQSILVTNNGPNIAFFRLGVGTQTALVTDTPILPYTAMLIERGASATHAGAICNSTQTAALYFTAGMAK
jgi:hypothetical protein